MAMVNSVVCFGIGLCYLSSLYLLAANLTGKDPAGYLASRVSMLGKAIAEMLERSCP